MELAFQVGEARQGTSQMSKQDRFPESAVRKRKRTAAKAAVGEWLVNNTSLRGASQRR